MFYQSMEQQEMLFTCRKTKVIQRNATKYVKAFSSGNFKIIFSFQSDSDTQKNPI